ncbi:beta-ketoacyl-[acyl-carrier-protein] synthase family protein [Streptomyces sp. MAR4 CNX-425]|uniref:beta-ketoacyl-[acyl-carrier-protein] synthase family protein n=1 Tax=Streptomyces sp. MAR4 CNX-425 TaxID=3406343 RepID=UPI003B50A76C
MSAVAPSGRAPFDAAVTGIGMVTAAGVGTAATWEAVKEAAATAAREVPELAGMPVSFACTVPDFDAAAHVGRRKAWRLDRSNQLAVAAAAEAVADSGLDPSDWDGARVGVVLGCGLGGATSWEKQYDALRDGGPAAVSATLIPMLVPNMSSGYVAMEIGARGPNLVTATACASGTTAVGTARELLRSGVCDVVVTGGTESCVVPSISTGFSQMGALSGRREDITGASRPFDVDRDGFVLAEGAAVLVLERQADAEARKAGIRARVSGYGASADAYNATAPDPEGSGAELALRAALADADLAPRDIRHVNAHGTSTPLNDRMESRLIRRVLGDRPSVTSVKGVLGHSLGAAGAIEAAVTVLSVEHAYVPPTANLDSQDPEIGLDVVAKEGREAPAGPAVSNSFGFGGQNAVLVFTAA